MYSKDIHKRIEAAYSLVHDTAISREKFEAIRTLLKGINPRLDKALASSSKALSDLEKLQEGEIIDLTIENLPEHTEKAKKRKKALLLFLSTWKDLKSEIARVRAEFDTPSKHTSQEQVSKIGRILTKAKGPLGLITLVAVIIVGFTLFAGNKTKSASFVQPTSIPSASQGQKIKVINFNDKQLPLSELYVGHGPDCGKGGIPHYHAVNGVSVKALDKTTVQDPGACGFGKVEETRVEEVSF